MSGHPLPVKCALTWDLVLVAVLLLIVVLEGVRKVRVRGNSANPFQQLEGKQTSDDHRPTLELPPWLITHLKLVLKASGSSAGVDCTESLDDFS